MDLLRDFVALCFDHGIGGLLLLALAAGVLLVALSVLARGIMAAASAFGRGWREGASSDDAP
ncbi:hypothetical protein JK386_04260 [Nocardioides sp. zg-536]|uniref:Uncharacterized protein n=1 Tax=Nocardioides faecalis TaxID=2803858 RepID=A0A938Y4J2_9ACTN|nr:hypothetical protein [Nocardioides faecalis]MBM9459104.1 hypothetical protein [Nocardioides faecalis]QVI57362.1 hypothetical protein KG111_09520 [Nocardioides faecalis]